MKVRCLQLLVLVMAFMLTLPAAVLAQPQYFCRMTEQVVSTCCCASARSHRPLENRADSELRAAPLDCCERIAPLGSSPAGSAPRPDPTIQPALLSVLLEEPRYGVERVFTEALVARPPRGPPPRVLTPLFITYCALLI